MTGGRQRAEDVLIAPSGIEMRLEELGLTDSEVLIAPSGIEILKRL